MKNEELIKRYIYAVTKSLPIKIKKDVADELNSIISDMLEGRTGGTIPTGHDVRVVLTELGTPEELNRKYSPDSEKCLIGAPYYSKYKMVLKIVIACVLFGVTLAQIMASIVDGALWHKALIDWITSICTSLFSAFSFVTIIFAVFYHKSIDISSSFSIDDLPPVPTKNEKISKWEPISGIVFSVAFAFVFLFFPQIFCIIFSESGQFIPFFNLSVIESTRYIIVLFALLGIIRECAVLVEGRYTIRLAVVTGVTNLISIALTFVWFLGYKIMNPDFTQAILSLFDAEVPAFITGAFGNLDGFFLAVIVFAMLLDIAVTTVKALKTSK